MEMSINTATSPFHKWVLYFYGHQSLCNKSLSCLAGIVNQIQEWDSNGFKSWLADTTPNAAFYYNAIQSGHGFRVIRHIDSIEIGHVIAITYRNDDGHLMLVRNFPKKVPLMAPVFAGYCQYEVEVYHSRPANDCLDETLNTEPGWDSQAEFFWLYSDTTNGDIVGYARYSNNQFKYYPQSEHALIIGALL